MQNTILKPNEDRVVGNAQLKFRDKELEDRYHANRFLRQELEFQTQQNATLKEEKEALESRKAWLALVE